MDDCADGQAFAFAAREYLRKLVVGKDVQFSVAYTVSSMTPPRENGTIFLPGGVNVLENAVAEGWVKVREQSGKKEKSEEEEATISKLKALEEQAKTAGKGVWGSGGKVETKGDVAGKEKELLEQWKGKDVDGLHNRCRGD
jgi:staphylococcal nuclease domain-containing protein 1